MYSTDYTSAFLKTDYFNDFLKNCNKHSFLQKCVDKFADQKNRIIFTPILGGCPLGISAILTLVVNTFDGRSP